MKKLSARRMGALSIQAIETARNIARRMVFRKPAFEYFLKNRHAFRIVRREALRLGGAVEIVKQKTEQDQTWFQRMTPGKETILCRVKGLSGESELELRTKLKLKLAPLRMPAEELKQQAPKDIRIETALQEDLDELHKVEARSFSPENQAPIEELKNRLRDGLVLKAIHERTGKIVGMLFTSPRRFDRQRQMMEQPVARTGRGSVFSPHHHFIDLAVLPEFRRTKVGAALMSYGLGLAKERFATKVFLHAVTPENFSFFERLGFFLHEPTFNAQEEKRKAAEGITPTRIYWMPLATGKTEKADKNLHEQMQQQLQAMLTAEDEYAGKHLAVVLGWLGEQLPEADTRNREGRARQIGRFLAKELVSRTSVAELGALPLFKGHGIMNTSRIQWILENKIRKQFDLEEIGEDEWHRRERGK